MSTRRQTLITSRDKQGIDFMSKAEAGFNASRLDGDGTQRILGSREFWAAYKRLIYQYSVSNRYADEEVASTWCYPEEFAPKAIIDQINILHQLFPELSIDLALKFVSEILPNIIAPDIDGSWFPSAIPAWEKIGRTYNEAVEKILKVLAGTRLYYNQCESELRSQFLQQQERSILMYEELKRQQPGDIKIVYSQFGMRHRGRSTRRGIEVFHPDECGHGLFSGAALTLTHPERFVRWEQLHADFPGDKYGPDGGGSFSRAPFLRFSVGRVETGPRSVGKASGLCGSASWLLPQLPSLEQSNN